MSRSCLVMYLTLVFYITVLSRTPQEARTCDLRLFWTYRHALIDNAWDLFYEAILNVAMFVPVGLLIHGSVRRWRPVRTFLYVLLPSAVLSAAIEMLQYAGMLGLCELDDVIHNTLGAMIGSSIYTMFSGVVWKREEIIIYWKRIVRGMMLPGTVGVLFLIFNRLMHRFAGRM